MQLQEVLAVVTSVSVDLNHINEMADYWRKVIGMNVIPSDTANKRTYENWKEWQNKPIAKELHEQWKNAGAFSKDIAIILGKAWHREDKKDLYLVFIDLDNKKAIDEVCQVFNTKNLEELSQQIIVEQHKDDGSKAHLYFYSNHIFKKKSSDALRVADGIDNNEIPSIEVKGLGDHGIAFCSPSLHKSGQPYQIIGIREPRVFAKK